MGRSNNAAAVRAMWDAWSREGIEGLLAIAPPDVEWRPSSAGGKALWGSRDIRTFYKAMEERGERIEAEITHVEELGDEAVLVTGHLRRTGPHGSAVDQMAWLYSFREGRLWRATAHQNAAEAREAARFAGSDRPDAKRPPMITIDESPGDGDAVIALSGELDIATAPLVQEAVARAAAPGRTVRVDLGGLAFIDSTGMRAVLAAQRAAEQEGWTLRLGRAPDSVQRVFVVSGLESLLPFDPPGA